MCFVSISNEETITIKLVKVPYDINTLSMYHEFLVKTRHRRTKHNTYMQNEIEEGQKLKKTKR